MIPVEIAEKARLMFQQADWDRVEQSDMDYYTKKTVYPGMEEEIYSSNFWWAQALDVDPELQEIFYTHVLPAIGTMPTQGVYMHCYKLMAGDHYRLHVDDRADTGFIWYLSKNWKPDWGGLLVETNEMKVTVPEFNKLVVRRARTPHLVTTVEKWAREPRYMLVGFF